MRLCICGPERSGTTAAAVLMGAGTGLSLLNDPPESIRVNIGALAGKPMERGFRRRVESHDIVKVPGFVVMLEQLWATLPPFDVLCLVRDPRDCLASALERATKGAQVPHLSLFWTPASTGVADPDPAVGLGIRWREYMEAAERFKVARPERFMWLRYEDAWNSWPAVLAKVAERFALLWRPEALGNKPGQQWNKWIDASYSRAIAGPGRWQADLPADQAATCLEAAGPVAKRLGYA